MANPHSRWPTPPYRTPAESNDATEAPCALESIAREAHIASRAKDGGRVRNGSATCYRTYLAPRRITESHPGRKATAGCLS